MFENYQKTKQIIHCIFHDIDLFNRSKDVLKAIMNLLQIDQSKVNQKNILAEKIIQIYEAYKGQYDQYLTQSKFRTFNSQAKDLLWTIFKQLQERHTQRKFTTQQKPTMMKQHISHVLAPSNQNMNMNMVNMYLDVPHFNTVEEVQIFQRKMFEIYKNVIPQVLSSMSASSNQSPYFRNSNPYQPYHMGNMNNMGSMSTLSGLGSMGSMGNVGSIGNIPGMSGGLNGMGSMGGLAGMSNMSGMANMNGMSSMANLPGISGLHGIAGSNNFGGGMPYSAKTPQFYDSSNAFSNRYFYDNKGMGNFNYKHATLNSKNTRNQLISTPQNSFQNVGFHFCGQRTNTQENRGTFKPGIMYPQQMMNLHQQQFQRKIVSHKYYQDQPRYENNFQSQNFQQYYPGIQKRVSNKQKQSNNNAQIFPNQLPRKIIKRKDDQVSIFIEQVQPDVDNSPNLQKIECICKQKNELNICYYCRIKNLDPLNQVQEILKLFSVNSNVEKLNFQNIIEKKVLERINKHPQRLDIELRCINMDKKQCQIAWPQNYILKIDEQIIEDTTQKISNSKKRKDKPFIFSKNFGNQKNGQQNVIIQLQVKNSQKNQKFNFLYGIFVISKNTIQKIYEKIKKQSKQKNISQYFKDQPYQKTTNNQNQSKIQVSPLQPHIKKLIKDPIRGELCTHPQCFDLEVFLSYLIISPNRQWKCLICSKECRSFVIDNQQKNVLTDIAKMIKEPTSIIFYKNGSHMLKYQNQKQDNNKALSKQQKNKEIHQYDKIKLKQKIII